MSEQEIRPHDFPMGSPILAYGTSPRYSRTRTLFFIVAGIFLALLVGVVWILQTSIRIPERSFALAAVRPRINLPDGAPEVWRDAIQRSPMPVLLGLTITEQQIEPFAILMRGFASPRFVQEHAGAFSLVSEKPIAKKEEWGFARIARLLVRTIPAPAFVRVDARAIDPAYDLQLEGAVHRDGVWKTNIRIKKESGRRITDGDFSLDLRAFPDAWPLVKDAIQRSGFFFESAETPATIAWSETDGPLSQLRFGYMNGPTSSTIRMFAAAAGVFEKRAYKLPDDVVVEELYLPKNSIHATTTGDLELSHGMVLKIRTDELALEFASSTTSTRSISPCSKGGWPILYMKDNFIAKIRQKIEFLQQMSISNLVASEKDGFLEFCLR